MLCVAGGKGGCGKTTVTLALARAHARAGTRPLAVDADVDMPDLHARVGLPREPGLAAVAEEHPPESVAHPMPDRPGAHVLPAGVAREAAAGLRRAATWDGPVIVDCPAGAGPEAAVPLRHADRTLLVTTRRRESLVDTAKTAAMSLALGTPTVGAVVRRPPEAPGEAGQAAAGPGTEAIARLLGAPVLSSLPTLDPPLDAHDGIERAFDRVSRAIRCGVDQAADA